MRMRNQGVFTFAVRPVGWNDLGVLAAWSASSISVVAVGLSPGDPVFDDVRLFIRLAREHQLDIARRGLD